LGLQRALGEAHRIVVLAVSALFCSMTVREASKSAAKPPAPFNTWFTSAGHLCNPRFRPGQSRRPLTVRDRLPSPVEITDLALLPPAALGEPAPDSAAKGCDACVEILNFPSRRPKKQNGRLRSRARNFAAGLRQPS